MHDLLDHHSQHEQELIGRERFDPSVQKMFKLTEDRATDRLLEMHNL